MIISFLNNLSAFDVVLLVGCLYGFGIFAFIKIARRADRVLSDEQKKQLLEK